MKTTINNKEVYNKYNSLKGKYNDYITRYDLSNFASRFFDSYFSLKHTNKIKDIKVKDKYNNILIVRVIGKSNINDMQLYIIKHKNPYAKKFKIEYKIYSTDEISKLNLQRIN